MLQIFNNLGESSEERDFSDPFNIVSHGSRFSYVTSFLVRSRILLSFFFTSPLFYLHKVCQNCHMFWHRKGGKKMVM